MDHGCKFPESFICVSVFLRENNATIFFFFFSFLYFLFSFVFSNEGD